MKTSLDREASWELQKGKRNTEYNLLGVFDLVWNRRSAGLIPQQIAFGILSVLLPIYVIEEIGGNLWDVGFISAMKSFVQIPAVVFWARWIDKKARCKIFLLISFLVSGLMIFTFTLAKDVWSFLGLNVVLSIFYVAQAPAIRVLIAESCPRPEWETELAQHRFVLGISGIVGLLAGALWMIRGDNPSLMLLCGVLVLVSLTLSAVLIHDPRLMIERKIARFERFVHLAGQAYNLAYSPTSYTRAQNWKMYFTRYPNPKHLILGIFFFPMASSMVLTTIPIFLSVKIGVSSSLIFSIVLVESIMILISYTLIGKHRQTEDLKIIEMASVLCLFVPILLLVSGFLPFPLALTVTSTALAIAGFTWPYFSVPSTVLWMETAPRGTGGMYNACVTLGTALGSLMGGLVPLHYGYQTLFILSTTVSGMSLFFFIISTRMNPHL